MSLLSLLFRQIIFISVSIHLVLIPAVAHAQDAVPLDEGDPAPFSGTLLTNQAAASLLAEINSCKERSDSDLTFELESERARCDLNTSLLQINLDSQQARYESIVLSQDEQLEYLLKANNPKPSREVMFVIGVLSGVAATVAAGYSVHLVSNSR